MCVCVCVCGPTYGPGGGRLGGGDGGRGGGDVLLGSEGVVGDEAVCRQTEVRQELDQQLVPLRQHWPAHTQADTQVDTQVDRTTHR